jgi:hypothetical protein
MRLQRRVRTDVRDDVPREFGEPEEAVAISSVYAWRSRVAAIDAAIEGVAGRTAMSAGEVIDVLLDIRVAIAFSAQFAAAWEV